MVSRLSFIKAPLQGALGILCNGGFPMAPKINGSGLGFPCEMQEDCAKHIEQTARIADKVDASAQAVLNIVEHLSQLHHLEFIAKSVDRQTDLLLSLVERLVELAAPKESAPQAMEHVLVAQSKRSKDEHLLIYKILGAVIVGLVIILVFVLTGKHLGWIGM